MSLEKGVTVTAPLRFLFLGRLRKREVRLDNFQKEELL